MMRNEPNSNNSEEEITIELEDFPNKREAKNENENNEKSIEIKVSPKRWIVLLSFCLYSFSNGMNWIIFAPIALTVMKEYNISSFQVNSLSMVYMLVYVVGVVPASYIADKKSLKAGMVIGSFLNALGAIMRCFPFPFFSISEMNPLSFYVVFLGQLMDSISQTFFLAIPPKIVQRWFGSEERVFATAVATISNQLGCAVGLILPPLIVQQKGENIIYLLIICSLISTVAVLLIIFFFESFPRISPSISSAIERKLYNERKKKQSSHFTKDNDNNNNNYNYNQSTNNHSNNVININIDNDRDKESVHDIVDQKGLIENESASYIQAFWKLLRDKNYVMLSLITGMFIGGSYAQSTLLSQMLSLLNYTESQSSVLAFILLISGMIGSVILGQINDKLHLQQRTLIFYSSIICLFGILAFTMICREENQYFQLILCCCILGFFESGILPIFMDSSIEITFPLPQAFTSNIVMAFPQIFGIIFIISMNWFLERTDTPDSLVLSANVFLMFWFIMSLVLATFYFPESKRLKIENQSTVVECFESPPIDHRITRNEENKDIVVANDERITMREDTNVMNNDECLI